MRKLAFIILLVSLSIPTFAQTQYPTYKDVIEHFFKLHTLDQYSSTSYRFAKTSEGYVLQSNKNEQQKFIKVAIVWDAKTQSYPQLNLPKADQNSASHKDYYLRLWSSKYMDLHPYYGYIGWSNDVITYFKQKKKLSTEEYYSLGRAYSEKASNYLNNNSGFADSSQLFIKKEDSPNQLNKEQLKKYRKARHAAIKNYKKVFKLKPTYETSIGRIDTKLQNEYMTAYLDLCIYQNEQEALKELPKSSYNAMITQTAKSYLSSTQKNGILFTNGDNDTYPLLYLQAKKQYRTDIQIINSNLLQNSNYANYIRRQNIKMLLSPQDISGEQNLATFYQAGQEKLSINKLIQLIKERSPEIISNISPSYNDIKTNKLYIETSSQKNIEMNIRTPLHHRYTLLVLDICQSNITKRNIHFTNSRLLAVEKYLYQRGAVYALSHEIQSSAHPYLIGATDIEQCEKVVEIFKTLKNEEVYKGSHLYVFLNSISHLANTYATKKEKNKLISLFYTLWSRVPPSKIDIGLHHVVILEALITLSLDKEIEMLTTAYLKQLRTRAAEAIKSKNRETIKWLDFDLKKLSTMLNATSPFQKDIKEIQQIYK